MTRKPFLYVERNSEPLDLINIDLYDLKYVETRGGKSISLLLLMIELDIYKYLLPSKDEAINAFKRYKTEVKNPLNKKIKAIRSDKGGEYEFPFEQFFSENEIIHQTDAPYSPH